MPDDDVILLDRPIVYVDADLVSDDDVDHEDKTAEYVLGHVDDDYEEVVLVEPAEEQVAADDVVMLDLVRIELSDIDTSELELV